MDVDQEVSLEILPGRSAASTASPSPVQCLLEEKKAADHESKASSSCKNLSQIFARVMDGDLDTLKEEPVPDVETEPEQDKAAEEFMSEQDPSTEGSWIQRTPRTVARRHNLQGGNPCILEQVRADIGQLIAARVL